MASIELASSGHNEFATVTGAKTLAEADCGVVQNVTATATLTLPSTVAGFTFPIRVGKEGITLTVAPAAVDKIMGNGFTSADNKAFIFTNQAAGSFVTLVGDGTNGWVVSRVLGTGTRAA